MDACRVRLRGRCALERAVTYGAFGCALDVLDAQEKVGMKNAYISALKRGVVGKLAPDPYGLFAPFLRKMGVEMVGRLEIETHLTPRPHPCGQSLVTEGVYRSFIDSNGCLGVSLKVRDFVFDKVMPLKPLLIGVDHSLTGGVLMALSRKHELEGLHLLVLDAHFDAVPTSVRRNALLSILEERGEGGFTPAASIRAWDIPDTYNCGTWLSWVISSGVVRPWQVTVVGVSDYPYEVPEYDAPGFIEYRKSYLSFVEAGVRVVSKRELRERGLEQTTGELFSEGEFGSIYISIDADVAFGKGAGAVRFFDNIGLEQDEVLRLAEALAGYIDERKLLVAGMDLVEIDVHLADLPGGKDRTVELFSRVLEKLVNA